MNDAAPEITMREAQDVQDEGCTLGRWTGDETCRDQEEEESAFSVI